MKISSLGSSFEEYRADVESLFRLMRYFAAPVYTCSASSERWGMSESFDKCAEECRMLARVSGVVARTGQPFWDWLRPFRVYSYDDSRCEYHQSESDETSRMGWAH